MRERGPFLLIAIGLASVGLWAALTASSPSQHPETARYTDRQTGVELAAGFSSYSTLEQAAGRLASQHYASNRRRLARPPDRRYPPHVLDTLTVDAFPMLGTQGRLRLEYFNDRLYEVGYQPQDPGASAAALKRSDPHLQRDRNGRAERIAEPLRIATNVEMASNSVGEFLGTEPYVLWQDLRLVAERDRWDERFGALPDRAP